METLKYATETKAVKDHKCNFCELRIASGDKYMKSTHKLDGDVYDWKSHTHCHWIAQQLKMYDDADDGVTGEMFQEGISDYHYTIITQKFPEIYNNDKYADILRQLRYVTFREKLSYVIRHQKSLPTNTPHQ